MKPESNSTAGAVEYESLDTQFADMDRLQQAVWVYDFDQPAVLWGNPGGVSLWQAGSLDELRKRDLSSGMTETVSKRLLQYKTDFLRDKNKQFREIWTLYPNGEPQTVEVVFSGIRLRDGRMAMFCEALSDASLDTDALRSAEALLHTSVMITLYTSSGVPLYRNPAARSAVRSHNETLSDHFVSGSTIQLLHNTTEDEVKVVASVHTDDGSAWHDITARRCLDAASGEHAWLISEVDVSRLKATEEHAQFLADHDTLTGLPNRNYVSVGFQNRIDQIQAAQEKGALIFIDLDKFKDVNDTLGHDAGDRLLICVAERLRNLVSTQDSVARLGGDEFLLLLCPIKTHAEIESLAQNILSELSETITLQNREINITPSIGISVFPDNGRNINDLMRHADLAMYHTKDKGRNNFAFFSTDLSEAVESRITLESELVTALQKDQFVTYFQPRVNIRNNSISSAEALVRWIHPEKGLISPATFIPACEASGLISELGKTVLRQSVQAQRAWSDSGYNIRVSVNLSPLQFGEESLVSDIIGIVESNGGDPRNIELEITESVLLGHDEATIGKLHALVEHGFRFAIDDFGTGYSNLAYLHRYPIRCLKIDRSFILELDNARPIIELIVSMARLFKLDVVAEGVETEEQLNVLQSYDCQEYQGFFFEKPIPFDEFTDLLERHQPSLAA